MLQPDGSVEGVFAARAPLEGYSGLLHGGVAAAFLDGAMTNCLFAHGVRALTAELTVRYREPVAVPGKITTHATLTDRMAACASCGLSSARGGVSKPPPSGNLSARRV